MQTLVILLALFVTVATGLSFYMGWFKLWSRRSGRTSDFTFSVSKPTMVAARDQLADKVRGLGHASAHTPAPQKFRG